NNNLQDTLLAADSPVTRLDSVIASMRLAALTGSYPFVPKGEPNQKLKKFKYNNWVDSMAIEVVNLRILWASAHSKLAERYYSIGDYKNFSREMNAIVEDRPVNTTASEYAANKLIDAGQIILGEYFLKKLHRQKPSFFSYKWLGQIALERKNIDKAFSYLGEAVKINNNDAQLLYNLAGAYYFKGDYGNALKTVEKSLSIEPKNARTLNFYNQLKAVESGKQ
ncbi:MAG: tetratricopeptide repeat protein, partial [Ignavibacteriaceae bacterium]|nr:tetratricopeptide repeat protein [Ignavibacteriaceae bacterium]